MIKFNPTMTAVLDHTMIRIENLEETRHWYKQHFDWEEKDRWEADTFTNIYMGPENMHDEGGMLELTYNHGNQTYNFGDAWSHIALRVQDIHRTYERLIDDGVEDYRNPDSCGGEHAYIKDPDGHEIKLIERVQGVQWSIDHTMINVGNINEAIGWYTRVLDYSLVERDEQDSFALYIMKPKDAAEEAMSVGLAENNGGQSSKKGDAWGHMCIRAEDLQSDWEMFVERGADDYRNPESCDNLFAFTKDADGYEIEILARNSNTDSLFPS